MTFFSTIFSLLFNFAKVVATETLTSERYNDTANVRINVTEILSNENNPNFTQSSYEANITEGVSAGEVIKVSTWYLVILLISSGLDGSSVNTSVSLTSLVERLY